MKVLRKYLEALAETERLKAELFEKRKTIPN